MKAIIEREKREKNVRFNGKLKTLLLKLSINPETVIVVRENELLTLDDIVNNKDTIKILSVISGG